MYRFIYSICRDEHIAEEITQETFFKALKNIDSFRGNCKLNVWLCQIAKNTFYSHYSKQNKLKGIVVEAVEPQPHYHEQMFILKEDALRIHRILHLMNEPYKEVFTLRVFGELSFAEISRLFGKSESWARVTFYRAKQMLQKKLVEGVSDD